MSKDSTLFVGLDTHKTSIAVAYIGSERDDTVQDYGTIGTLHRDIDRLIRRLQSKATKLFFAYEAGPCGYWLYRYLTGKGFHCIVAAPSRLPKDKIKTDRRDARTIAVTLRNADLAQVYVPDVEDESIRDLIRARTDLVNDLKAAKQRLNSFLLRHDQVYHGKRWSRQHWLWLSERVFSTTAQNVVLKQYMDTIEDRQSQLTFMEQQIDEYLPKWSRYPVVQALQALKGVRQITAMTMVAEIIDFKRFENPSQLFSWLGLVPSENTSGGKRRQGSITKCGNSHARKALIESGWSYRHPEKLTRDLMLRQEGLPDAVKEIAWRAQLRLCKRYRDLNARYKNKNIVVVAIARELAAFMWEIVTKGLTQTTTIRAH
ncbi:IS110 family transposase [Kistimonas scapharcae]|uniref:IS110 family transposase n=1 Tax=Kistimonas scapharcae TaxID=1036133 RepID=A0ABP8UYQ9_9GAMM